MTSSRSRRSRLGLRGSAKLGLGLGLGLAVGLFGLAACANESGDGAGAGTTEMLPVRTIPVEDTSGLIRYTDRELVLDDRAVPKTGRDSASRERKIADARRAGPSSISASAGVIDRAAVTGGQMLPLRAGTATWVCLTDDPITPVDDPVCLNRVAQRWASGWYKGLDTFRHEGLGVAYKLRGGASASTTDPYLIRPLEGDSWIIEPPHVILIFQDTTGLGALPDDPGQGGPWVSWRGTPYQHVKVPLSP